MGRFVVVVAVFVLFCFVLFDCLCSQALSGTGSLGALTTRVALLSMSAGAIPVDRRRADLENVVMPRCDEAWGATSAEVAAILQIPPTDAKMGVTLTTVEQKQLHESRLKSARKKERQFAMLALRAREKYCDLLLGLGVVDTIAVDLWIAKGQCEAILGGRTQFQGQAHPTTMTCQHRLATVLRRLGGTENLARAEALLKVVINGRTLQFGETHIDTLRAKQDLAELLHDNVGKVNPKSVARGVALLREVIEAFHHHPDYDARHPVYGVNSSRANCFWPLLVFL